MGTDNRLIGPGGLRAPCVLACAMRSLAIVITIVSLFFLFFFLLRLLLLTHFKETPMCENLCPPIFWYRRYMQQKNFKKSNCYFFTKKTDFRAFFSTFYGQRSVTAAWATRSPWSISNANLSRLTNLQQTGKNSKHSLYRNLSFEANSSVKPFRGIVIVDKGNDIRNWIRRKLFAF